MGNLKKIKMKIINNIAFFWKLGSASSSDEPFQTSDKSFVAQQYFASEKKHFDFGQGGRRMGYLNEEGEGDEHESLRHSQNGTCYDGGRATPKSQRVGHLEEGEGRQMNLNY